MGMNKWGKLDLKTSFNGISKPNIKESLDHIMDDKPWPASKDSQDV